MIKCLYSFVHLQVISVIAMYVSIPITEKSKALCNLGSTYTHLCKFKDAQTALQQAFELAKKHFDMSSGTCIIKKTEILEKMGTLERRQGNVNESLKLLIQCVDLQKKHYSHYSSQHPGKNMYIRMYTCM